MTEPDYDGTSEDDGVLQPSDTLESDDMRADVLDTGIDAGEGYRGAPRFGTTWAEERRGEGLDALLAQEEPDTPLDEPWTDEDAPTDDGRPGLPRTGRLLGPTVGLAPGDESEAVAFDVGIDGGGATAEEAAMHLTDDPPFHLPVDPRAEGQWTS